MRARDRFRVGSITKTFVATAARQLAGERRLALEDTIERWLPGLVPDGGRITVGQLLNHTAGCSTTAVTATSAPRKLAIPSEHGLRTRSSPSPPRTRPLSPRRGLVLSG
jgi:CubicO group peptidase (beta-lactamase class C family)